MKRPTVEVADILRTQGDRFLERAAALAPHLPDVHINLSKLALEKRDWLAAEQSARRAIALSPALALPYENLVVALKRQGRWEDAEREIETGLKHCPPPSNLYNVLGELRQRRGDIRAASRLSSRRR